ncbi:MAG: sigma-70 family RNA polymerase sigma factor [Candidatus Saganbacteria bacterium]|nr:sigma-70 family RNA polymerase sigma factor [Candidatus Saganbacteria bacterium]
MSDKDSEDRIVQLLRQHFLKYSDEVVEKYKSQIDSTVKWYISNLPHNVARNEADDLISEAKMAFVDALKTWDPRKGDLWPYVSIRLKGSMQDYLRKRGTDPVTGIYEWVTQAANVYLAFNKELAHSESTEIATQIDSALKDLSDNERAVIVGYYQDDKTFKEIGKEIDLSESQVSRICKTATHKLKKLLNK